MAFAGSAQLHLLADGVVVLIGTVVGRADRLIVVDGMLLLVLVVRMSPAALRGPFVGGSIARSSHASHASRFLSLLSRGVFVPQTSCTIISSFSILSSATMSIVGPMSPNAFTQGNHLIPQ